MSADEKTLASLREALEDEYRARGDTSQISITTVFDNYAVDTTLATRWGFAAVIATASSTVLFDTGSDGAVLISNMEKLNLDPGTIRSVVISHLHNDHVGGLTAFLRVNANVLVYLPGRSPGPLHHMIDDAGARHRDVVEPTAIEPAIRTTGPLGVSIHEQALVVSTAQGLVVITGCAHPGIVHVVRKAHEMSPDEDIAVVMGGFHLVSASPSDVDEIIRAFRKLGVRGVAPSHCTGDLAREQLREAYGPDFIPAGAGMVLKFSAARAAAE